MERNVIVIGSGISGLTIANMLKNDHNVKILEKQDKIGGLIKCLRIDGNLFHLVGGHVFNSKQPKVLEWFWEHFDRDKEFLKAARNAKILLEGRLIGYPIEDHIYQLPQQHIDDVLQEFSIIAAKNDPPRLEDNFETFLKQSFGEKLYNLYFGPYNSKIWRTDLKQVPLEWLDGKLPMPNIADILQSYQTQAEEQEMVHSTFYYPVTNGSQFIVDRLAQGLDVELSCDVKSIAYDNGQISINNGERITDVLIYCGDVRRLHNMIHIDDEELEKALVALNDLTSNGTSNVLCETDDNDLSWLYLPESKFKAHRIIYTGNFSDTNNAGRKTCVVEFSGKYDEATILEELKLLPGNLKALCFNHEPNSYIIHQKDTRVKINTLKQFLEKYNIYLLGRFSEWEYYNMDKCIESAMYLHSKLSQQAVRYQ